MNYSKLFSPFSFEVYENYNSTLIKSSTKNIKDEQAFSFRGGYEISRWIIAGAAANSKILSDDRNLALNSSSNADASVFLKFSPIADFYISPYFGYTNKEQIGETDNGSLYGIESRLENFQFSDIRANSSFSFMNEDIMPRRNLSRVFSASLESRFDDNIYNTITAGLMHKRNDYYYADSSIYTDYNIAKNIQSRSESRYALQNKLRYDELLDIFSFDVSIQALWRKIDRDARYKPSRIVESTFDYKVDEFRLDFETSLSYEGKNAGTVLRFLITENEERYAPKKIGDKGLTAYEDRSKREFQKNNISERLAISISGSWNITSKDRIFYNFSQNKYRYDTPAEENYDDRDELLSIGRVEYWRKLNRYFEWFVNLEGNVSSLRYIFSERSSNNNIKRILTFSSGGYYKNSRVISKNTFTTSANYTVYDFEKLNPNLLSFSFRQLTINDSSSVKLSRSLSIRFLGYYKLSEQGNFNWTAFSEKPLRNQTEIYAEPVFVVEWKKIKYGAGVRFFQILSYLYSGSEKKLNTEYQSIGPLADIQFNSGSLRISITGWYEFITMNTKSFNETANLNFMVNWGL
ncbi:MAG TPA: hypothetical protein VHO28_05815 [Ignavibacteriales bacterium]|nr:hypothetical protein [Ignavibacteriales bacterium]